MTDLFTIYTPGFVEGRQYGRGKSGGQVRDEYRLDFDLGRGGFGKVYQVAGHQDLATAQVTNQDTHTHTHSHTRDAQDTLSHTHKHTHRMQGMPDGEVGSTCRERGRTGKMMMGAGRDVGKGAIAMPMTVSYVLLTCC